MHTVDTRITTGLRPSRRSATTARPLERTEPFGQRTARLLSAWAERRLLGAPDGGRPREAAAPPRRELPLPWS